MKEIRFKCLVNCPQQLKTTGPRIVRYSHWAEPLHSTISLILLIVKHNLSYNWQHFSACCCVCRLSLLENSVSAAGWEAGRFRNTQPPGKPQQIWLGNQLFSRVVMSHVSEGSTSQSSDNITAQWHFLLVRETPEQGVTLVQHLQSTILNVWGFFFPLSKQLSINKSTEWCECNPHSKYCGCNGNYRKNIDLIWLRNQILH